MTKAGACKWFIPDGFYPPTSTGNIYRSHESICVLNTDKADARIRVTLYFEDRDKMEGFEVECKAERTHHIRMDQLKNKDSKGVPMGVPYAMMVESNIKIVVQYTRLDTTQAEMSFMTAIAYPLV